jgi:hypothetical protein
MITLDSRLWHPWLRIQRLLRDMLGTRWDNRLRPAIREGTRGARQIQRAGWLN